jgi:hypothetical protein
LLGIQDPVLFAPVGMQSDVPTIIASNYYGGCGTGVIYARDGGA